jgi:hypothetical protein
VKWESREWNRKYGNEDNCFTADSTLQGFLFKLKNRKFALKAEKKDRAVYCRADVGPSFCDIILSDSCNVNDDSYGFMDGSSDDTYRNDTPFGTETLFAKSKHFRVKEIEVFEITALH